MATKSRFVRDGREVDVSDENPFPTSLIDPGTGEPIVFSDDPVPIVQDDSEVIVLASLSALNDNQIIDMDGYGSLSLTISAFPAASVITIYGNQDGLTTWNPIPLESFGSPTGNGTLTQISTTGSWLINKRSGQIKIELTTYGGSGSVAGQATLLQPSVAPRALVAHGAVADGTAASGYAVPVGGRVMKNALTSTYDTDGRRAELRLTAEGQVPTKPYAPRALDWNPAPTGSFTNDTAEHAIKALATGFRLNLTALQLSWSANSVGGTVTVLDATGGNTIFAYRLPQAEGGVIIPFPTPLVSQLSQGLFIKTPTALSGTLVWSAQGFTGGVS